MKQQTLALLFLCLTATVTDVKASWLHDLVVNKVDLAEKEYGLLIGKLKEGVEHLYEKAKAEVDRAEQEWEKRFGTAKDQLVAYAGPCRQEAEEELAALKYNFLNSSCAKEFESEAEEIGRAGMELAGQMTANLLSFGSLAGSCVKQSFAEKKADMCLVNVLKVIAGDIAKDTALVLEFISRVAEAGSKATLTLYGCITGDYPPDNVQNVIFRAAKCAAHVY